MDNSIPHSSKMLPPFPGPGSRVLEYNRVNKDNTFRLKGERKDRNSVSLVLSMNDSQGERKNIHFLFFLDADTGSSVASEMVEHRELQYFDMAFIANFIEDLLINLVPEWRPNDKCAKQNGEQKGAVNQFCLENILDGCNLDIGKKIDEDLKAEVEAIEIKFRHMFEKLSKMREDELENAHKRNGVKCDGKSQE